MSNRIDIFNADLSNAQIAALCGTDRAIFEAHNPNGIVARWRAVSDRLVAFGRGYLAYGDTGYLYNEINRLARLNRVNRVKLNIVLRMIEDNIAKAEAFLAENGAA